MPTVRAHQVPTALRRFLRANLVAIAAYTRTSARSRARGEAGTSEGAAGSDEEGGMTLHAFEGCLRELGLRPNLDRCVQARAHARTCACIHPRCCMLSAVLVHHPPHVACPYSMYMYELHV